MEGKQTKSLPAINTHTETKHLRVVVTAYTDQFQDEKESIVTEVKRAIFGCLFTRCGKCSEKKRKACDGVVAEEVSYYVQTITPHVSNPLDSSPHPIRIVASQRVFTRRDFHPSHTPCLGRE